MIKMTNYTEISKKFTFLVCLAIVPMSLFIDENERKVTVGHRKQQELTTMQCHSLIAEVD